MSNPVKTYHKTKTERYDSFDMLYATSKPVETEDAKGAFTLSAYDVLGRQTHIWAKDKTGENTTLRQLLIYGDDVNEGPVNPKTNNYLGQLFKHFDEAGLVTINGYDFKGNLLEKKREVISDADLLAVFNGPPTNWEVECFRVDWANPPTLEGNYLTSMEYDALNRVTKITYPEDVENERKELIPTYNRAGALESVKMDGDDYVNHIAYNAKGQRLMIAHGNNIMTRYVHDSKQFRLLRLRSEKYIQSDWIFTPDGGVKQDTKYTYDLSGNIVGTNETNVSECGIGGTNTLTREFNYDPLYRILNANVRENSPTVTPIWDDRYRSTDNTTTTLYTQYYSYDRLGNIQKLQHIGNNNFTRNFNYINSNNQLESINIGMTNYAFTYDNCGNQTQETSSRHFEWDLTNQLRSFYVFDGSTVSQYTHYLYDASGNRVKKLVWKQNGDYQSSTYIGNAFEYLTNGTEEQNTLHVMNDTSRIALIRLGDNFGDTTPAIKYNLEDHLGSSSVLIEDNGTLINREEYYPFGETSFGSYAKKKYKYSGKERDEESGMYYFKFRYQSAWTCRFISVDPISADYPFNSSYAFCENRVISGIELEGLEQIDHHILVQIQESTSALNVNMDLAPKSYLGETTRALGGRKWNARWFWSEALKQDASWFSPENQASINKGNIPTLDETYLKKMGANLSKSDFAKLRNNVTIGQTLEHHHMNHGRFTVGLPQSVHRGAGNKNFWHNPSFRNGMSKLAKGGVKAIAVLGVVFSVYDAMANNELSIIPVDFSSGWVDILEKGLKENNFTIVDAGLYNLNKFSQNYSVEWMTVDDMITFQNTGEAKGVYGGNVPAWKNQNQIRHDVYPYMLIKFKDNVVGIVTVPDK